MTPKEEVKKHRAEIDRIKSKIGHLYPHMRDEDIAGILECRDRDRQDENKEVTK